VIQNRRRAAIRAAEVLAFAAVAYFVYEAAGVRPEELWEAVAEADALFYAAVLVAFLSQLAQGWLWVRLMNALRASDESGGPLSLGAGLAVFVHSMFAKYVPGGIWNLLGRLYLGRKVGLTFGRQVAGMLYETVFLVFAAALFSLFYLGWGLAAVPLVAATAAVYGPATRGLERLARRLGRKGRFGRRMTENLSLELPRAEFFRFLALYGVNQLAVGVGFWLLLSGFGVVAFSWAEAAGLYALGWLIGCLSPLPGGLGVREGALAALLAPRIGWTAAAEAAVLARIWTLLGEAALYVAVAGARLLLKRTWA